MRNLFLIIIALMAFFPLAANAASPFRLATVADGLEYPWAVVFLPGGDYLVSERGGKMFRITPDGSKSEITGVPPVVARGQGGLLDLALDPNYENNRFVYFSYIARGMGGSGVQVARAKLTDDNRLEALQVIFKARPRKRTDLNLGSRLLFLPDGTLLVSVGDRFLMEEAQDPSNHIGSIVRINPDGTVPKDNPFVGKKGVRQEIYSYGHRNPQGLALQPGTGVIWEHEHGPQGGDEVNVLKSGANYGWPAITYGINYDGAIISTRTEAPGMEQPVIYWVPSIAPSGMAFYTGDKFPEWQGDLFVGALAGAHLRRLAVEGKEITEQEVMLEDLEERIRDVADGPDGYIYILTDSPDGRLIRLEPSEKNGSE